ncbi:MAG: penicillin-binding transpeptidase domain-containing protein [Balneolaceae bacterium]
MNERNAILSRVFLVLGLILLLPAAIVIQLLRVNLVEGENLRELWSNQTIHYLDIPAERGQIYDSSGTLLVANRVNYKLAVDPLLPGFDREQLHRLATLLSSHTGTPVQTYLNRVQNASPGSRYVVLERSIDVSAYDEISALSMRAVILEEEYQRQYNFGELASHVLGYVDHSLTGMGGLENHYNEKLKGTDGLQQVRRDRSNRIFAYVGAPRKQPKQGFSLHTTINAYMQAILEEELEQGVLETGSNYGTAIIMDPRSGAVRALANYPSFDPNEPGVSEPASRRNYALSDMLEPGSTFKLVTAIAATELGLVDFEEQFETPEDGVQLIHGQAMRDHDPLGTVDFTSAIAKSSNIAISEIAMRIPPRTFYQYSRNLGFGTGTYIDLPNESAGRLQRPYEWSRVTLPWMSIGYEVQVTPIQILQAYSAFANGGVMMRPYVVERISDERGRTVEEHRPVEVRRVANRETVDKLLPVFTEVVSDSGTGSWASVDGLPIAGKTGTAQKYIDGSYQTAYRASFVGFFPADEPRYAIIVLLDEPSSSIYGGYTAGKVFQRTTVRIAGLDRNIYRRFRAETSGDAVAVAPSVIGMEAEEAEQLLRSMGIPVRITGKGDRVMAQMPEAGGQIGTGEVLQLERGEPTASADGQLVTIPELRGRSMRQATSLLYDLGLDIEMIGSGTIYNQFPEAGEQMRPGRSVTVRGRARTMSRIADLSWMEDHHAQ